MTGRSRAPEGWLELALSLIIAMAAVGTAWAGFESAKWSGVQANSYAKASALRTESTRQSTTAGQFLTIDVTSFMAWFGALEREVRANPENRPAGGYEPDPSRPSGMLFNRFRAEFKPAVTAWLATRPLINTKAPATPFVMPEYQSAAGKKAESLLGAAEDLSAQARQANQRSDNYVLTAVLFALILFFASITGRSKGRSARITFTVTVVALVTSVVLLAILPVKL